MAGKTHPGKDFPHSLLRRVALMDNGSGRFGTKIPESTLPFMDHIPEQCSLLNKPFQR
jgi:hypothetical protein